MQPFVPLFRNPHLATIAGNYWRRTLDEQYFPVEERLYRTEPGVQVLVHSQRPRSEGNNEAGAKGELILVHGLEGSSQAGYARSLAQAALIAGYAVHRYNMRSCGGTEAVCGSKLYHSGQTGDLLAVTRELAEATSSPIYLAGFSLGGNVVLKLAGELGDSAGDLIAGVIAVSAPIDLAACSRQLKKPANLVYSRRFLDRLKKRIRLKEQLTPGLFSLDQLDQVKTIYEFDHLFTAHSFGFGTADNYYATQSANQFLDRIRVPGLIVQAKDDPLVPFDVYDHPAFGRNPCLRLIAVEHGGHLGFLSRRKPRFWLDGLLLEWLEEAPGRGSCLKGGQGNKAVADSVL